MPPSGINIPAVLRTFIHRPGEGSSRPGEAASTAIRLTTSGLESLVPMHGDFLKVLSYACVATKR
jgi:hypothetical protein